MVTDKIFKSTPSTKLSTSNFMKTSFSTDADDNRLCNLSSTDILSVVDGYLKNNRKLKRDKGLFKRRIKFCIRKV
uniref:Uncharacterized protein n=1 Tax=Romanomermis culicivorax TaxID=13658 RepID=A0A915ITA5_ROMCU